MCECFYMESSDLLLNLINGILPLLSSLDRLLINFKITDEMLSECLLRQLKGTKLYFDHCEYYNHNQTSGLVNVWSWTLNDYLKDENESYHPTNVRVLLIKMKHVAMYLICLLYEWFKQLQMNIIWSLLSEC